MVSAGEAHLTSQATILTALEHELRHLLALINVQDLKASLPRLKAALAVVVKRYGTASSHVAAKYYAAERLAAGVKGAYTPLRVDPPGVEQVQESVGWATKGLWSKEPDVASAHTLVEGVADKMVADVGRNTIIDNVNVDRKAKGWARIPEPDCCAFCAMLATRGAVYKEKSFAEANSGFEMNKDTPSDVKTHDHCRCHVEPVFNAYEPSAQIREWQALWRESTKGHGGQDAINAFRRAFTQ